MQLYFDFLKFFRRGIDKTIIKVLRERTEGNTWANIRKVVDEIHCEEYLYRDDLYTTLIEKLKERSFLGNYS